jgi:PAS domain S-box-containing protein
LFIQDLQQSEPWEKGEVEALVTAAEILGAALEKNKVEIKLRETGEYWKHEQEKVLLEMQNTRKFKQAVDSATDGFLISTLEPKILYVNPAWEKMTGYTIREAIDKTAQTLVTIKQLDTVFPQIMSQVQQGLTYKSEDIICVRKDGKEFPIELSVFPVLENMQTLFYVSLWQDITKRKEVEEMRSSFISIASHQLNTPLSGMKWFIDLLQQGKAGSLSPKQSEFVQNIADSNIRMIALVRSLLNVSRIESGRIIVDPRPTDIKTMLNEVLTDIQMLTTKKQQTIKIDIDPSLPQILLDQRLIRHVYMNLLSNSRKYSPEKTEIDVVIKKQGNEMLSQVIDHGYGIPKEDQEKIFTKFFRAPNVVRMEADGSGLGMYLVKIVIESSGGKVWFESEENKGTTVSFTLPLEGMKAKAGDVTIDPKGIAL